MRHNKFKLSDSAVSLIMDKSFLGQSSRTDMHINGVDDYKNDTPHEILSSDISLALRYFAKSKVDEGIPGCALSTMETVTVASTGEETSLVSFTDEFRESLLNWIPLIPDLDLTNVFQIIHNELVQHIRWFNFNEDDIWGQLVVDNDGLIIAFFSENAKKIPDWEEVV